MVVLADVVLMIAVVEVTQPPILPRCFHLVVAPGDVRNGNEDT